MTSTIIQPSYNQLIDHPPTAIIMIIQPMVVRSSDKDNNMTFLRRVYNVFQWCYLNVIIQGMIVADYMMYIQCYIWPFDNETATLFGAQCVCWYMFWYSAILGYVRKEWILFLYKQRLISSRWKSSWNFPHL